VANLVYILPLLGFEIEVIGVLGFQAKESSPMSRVKSI